MTGDVERLLDGIPALRGLPEEALRRLEETVVGREAAVGEYLFRQGEGQPPHVFYLLTATAEIRVGPPDEERAVSLARPGQFVGWLTVFTSDPFPVSARVLAAGEILQIPVAIVQDLVQKYPAVGQVLAVTMAQRVGELFHEIEAQSARGPLTRVQTFPFRRRVSEAMTSPATTLPPSATAREAATYMGEVEASSVIVAGPEGIQGIVTEKDLIQRVLARSLDPDRVPVSEVMSAPVVTLPSDAYLYNALGLMRRRHVRHLPVMEGGRLVGVLSMRELLALGTNATLELAEAIDGARSFEHLGEAHQQSLVVCADLLDEGVVSEEVSRLLSHINRDIHRRALELSILEMEEEGRGRLPLPFCFIVMGSHGRGENHFSTDQDHGMILADYPVEDWALVEPYFMDLGDKVSEGLARAGFPLCTGHVMSRNPVWRKPAGEWKEQVQGWYANPDSKAVRYTTLFYDFEPIWGDAGLAENLRAFITRGIQRNFHLLRSLYREASNHRVPLTFFKNFVTERSGPHKGQMDVKRSGLLFVVECARILALRHGVSETGTTERLEALAQAGAIPADEAEFVQTAYRTLCHFRLTAQAKKLRLGQAPDNYIDPQALPIQQRYLLRHALEATERLQGMVRSTFGDIF
ncbi:MAG: putative nucleotidyltransferase substrate binding domain-containing protein [Deferrisomatales bacterium]|nr:putative nucleotidyltransferase substrate binding domain-containing protein [Deferrisomatales bacterium]